MDYSGKPSETTPINRCAGICHMGQGIRHVSQGAQRYWLGRGASIGMAKPYSQDLRDRVVSSVASGRSCRATAALFGVSVASVVKWSQRWRPTGSVAAAARARHAGELRGGVALLQAQADHV